MRDSNEQWKFFNIMFQILKGLTPERESFRCNMNFIILIF